MSAIHWGKGPRWIISPEEPRFEPGTPRSRSPMTIYYGYADTGYRISHQGKRNRDGRRIGRRPFQGTPAIGPFYPWEPACQGPEPPCRIWCPVCGSLNDVALPDELRE